MFRMIPDLRIISFFAYVLKDPMDAYLKINVFYIMILLLHVKYLYTMI